MLKNKIIVLTVGGILSLSIAQPVFAVNAPAKPTVKLKPQKISSKLALAKLLMSHRTNRFNRFMMYDLAATSASPVSGEKTSSSTVSHSDTNVQVQGVDESDVLKAADDGYIYQIANNQVRIIKAFPVSELNQTATLKMPDENFYPSGIYVQNGKLVVVGTSWKTLAQPEQTSQTKDKIYFGWWFWNSYSQTRVLVYDVSDHSNPIQLRDIAVDGDYIDSRRINDNVYFVTRTYPHYYMYGGSDGGIKLKPDNMLPTISDTQNGKTVDKLLSLNDVSYFPDFVEPNYVVASSINIEKPDQPVVSKAYLGAGEIVYSSTQNLYLSASKYNFDNWGGGIMIAKSDTAPVTSTSITTTNDTTVKTQLFKFAIQEGQLNFSAAGEVPGTVLNQFSMDENGDYFRIATTTQSWASGTSESHNSLFVLDKNMKTVGKLENLAKGEQIYSTRFMGNRCYIVTFRLVDPLFAIDLSTPTNPTVMGELKIPGYSNYLHPYDENHLIGFGKDAAVYQSEQPNSDQFWAGGSAFYQGLKVALFDVSDMKNPKELHSITIGERGSNSPLLWNHKALYWDAEKHLFGFPLEIYQLAKPFDASQPWNYGIPTYQGAYIYEVTPENGFNLKAKLSQIPEGVTPHHEVWENYEYAYWDWEATNWFIDRLVRVDNSLYTFSNNGTKAYNLMDYSEQNSLTFNP